MKKYLLLCICTLLAQVAFAQDVIVKVDGEELKGKVLEITLSEITYLSSDTLDTQKYSIAKTEVFMVRYANGTKEVFTENLPDNSTNAQPEGDPAQMYFLGQQDAKRYYKGNGAMWGSAASMAIGPVGLLGPIIIGATKPKAYKNPVSSKHLLQDTNYVRGYEKQAHKRKIGKAAIGTGIGAATLVVLLVATLSAAY